MLKLSKLTDYAIILLSALSKDSERSYSASTLAAMTRIPEPTTAKILKMLSAGDLVLSIRGARGGYKATGTYEDTPLTRIIEVIEGDIALTHCAINANHSCSIKESCPLEGTWSDVNKLLYETLSGVKLASLLNKAQIRKTEIRDVI
jgi:FeS assembly SUF system regulator